MTHAKAWPVEADGHRQRALKAVRRLQRLGDDLARDLEQRSKTQNRSLLFQMRRWNRAIQLEMTTARQAAPRWPKKSESIRFDTIVACEQIERTLTELDTLVAKDAPVQSVRLTLSQAQLMAQELELRLVQVS
ncbi:MAG: hypothetical protein HY023_13330 [Chloroflexi bacterium]|nr:hypothetical protein [Chloroflexota bacterium]